MGTPRAPYIREKFTRDLSFARQLAKEYFRRFPKDQCETQVESWRQDSISKYRVHDEAVARAGRAALMKFLQRSRLTPT